MLQGPGQINKQKKIADSRRGGGSDHQKNPPVSAHAICWSSVRPSVMSVCQSVHIYKCTYVRMYTYVCMYVCMYVCVYVCVCVGG